MTQATQIEKVDGIDLRSFKEQLKKKLPPDSPILLDLLNEPDSMPSDRAEVLIPHYLKRLERELDRNEARRRPQMLLRTS
jgi:hypothetical protein